MIQIGKKVTVLKISNPWSWSAIYKKSYDLLTPGQQYTVANIEVRSCHTRVFLDKFPGIAFNSCWFAEEDL